MDFFNSGALVEQVELIQSNRGKMRKQEEENNNGVICQF